MRNALAALRSSAAHQLQAALTPSCFIPAPLLTEQVITPLSRETQPKELDGFLTSTHLSKTFS